MCSTAFAPGTISPSISVVRKILLSQTTGDECPRPGMGVFHLMFLESLQSAGKLVSEDTPLPSGPRHWDQLCFGAASELKGANTAKDIRQAISATRGSVSLRLIVK